MGHRNLATTKMLALILVIAPLFLGSNRPVIWMFWASIIFAMAFFWLLRKPRFLPPQNQMPFFVMTAILLIVLTFHAFGIGSVAPRASLLALVRTASVFVFFALVFDAASAKSAQNILLNAIFASAILQAILGIAWVHNIVQTPDIFFNIQYIDSATGTFINRNAYAMFLGMGLLVGASRMLSTGFAQPNKIRQLPFLLKPKNTMKLCGIVIILTALLLSKSRMGLFSTLLAGAVLLKLNDRNSIDKPAALLFLALILSPILLYSSGFLQQMDTLSADFSARLELFAQTFQMIAAKPFTGHGADSFLIAFPQFHTSALDPGVVWDKPHNTYLTNWSELGLIAGSLPIALTLWVVVKLVKPHKNDPIIAATLAVIVQVSLHSLVDFGMEIQANVFVFTALLAIALQRAYGAVSHRPINEIPTPMGSLK